MPWLLFGSAFYALASSDAKGAGAFFEQWRVEAEPGEVTVELEGDVGLVPLGFGTARPGLL